MRLDEDDTLLGVNAGGQPVQYHFMSIFPKGFCVVQSSERMNIHDAIDAVIFGLERNVVLYRSHIVAYMLSARRPCARENALSHFCGEVYHTGETGNKALTKYSAHNGGKTE
jgi:hypothetical protein